MKAVENLKIRNATPLDHTPIISVIKDWWGGRDLRASIPKLFLMHFSNTSFIAESDSKLYGFLIGFFSQTYPDEAYIHFVGVHPDMRHMGLARTLYNLFFKACLQNSRTIVKSCTAPINKGSIAFHTKMGFSIEPGNSDINGLPITHGYLHEDDQKVLFKKVIH